MSKSSARNRAATSESSLCQFPFADGRRCRMLRHPGHPSLCIFHARAELQLLESDRLGTELAQTLTGAFMTATEVNHILGKLYTAVAQNRVSPRNAATLAYIGQLLLTSVGGIKSEFKFSYKFDQWIEMNRNATPLSPPQSVQSPNSNAPDPKAPIVITANQSEEAPTDDVADPPSKTRNPDSNVSLVPIPHLRVRSNLGNEWRAALVPSASARVCSFLWSPECGKWDIQ
jgi:hypothetical protein